MIMFGVIQFNGFLIIICYTNNNRVTHVRDNIERENIMNTVKFATFKTIPEIHREIIYDKIIGIYNKNTGVFDMLDDTDNVNVIIKDEHIMNEKIVNENILSCDDEKFDRKPWFVHLNIKNKNTVISENRAMASGCIIPRFIIARNF